MFEPWLNRIESVLGDSLPDPQQAPESLHAAMCYAVLGGGKRIRPMLVYASGALFDVEPALLDPAACAVELIHAYSLVHDDLPSMDNDALRRGRPTVHVAFGEATAILAGDALQTLAFRMLADAEVDATTQTAWMRVFARAAGAEGMCGGQALDMDATGQAQSLAELEHMHSLKTGALIRAAVYAGALAGNATDGQLTRLDGFATDLGLAFQLRDDLLDIESSSEQLGKTAGKDAAQAKSTYPALLGIDGARKRLQELATAMEDALAPYGERALALQSLTRLAIERKH